MSKGSWLDELLNTPPAGISASFMSGRTLRNHRWKALRGVTSITWVERLITLAFIIASHVKRFPHGCATILEQRPASSSGLVHQGTIGPISPTRTPTTYQSRSGTRTGLRAETHISGTLGGALRDRLVSSTPCAMSRVPATQKAHRNEPRDRTRLRISRASRWRRSFAL